MLGKDLEPKGNAANASLTTLLDILLGAAIGGYGGAALGWGAMPVGALLAAVGKYKGSNTLATMGISLALANGYQNSKSTEGTEEGQGENLAGFDLDNELKEAGERVGNFHKNLIAKLKLDKLLKKRPGNGSGMQGFNGTPDQYLPTHRPADLGEVDTTVSDALSELDRIEEEVNRSAKDFNQENNMSGFEQNKNIPMDNIGMDGAEAFEVMDSDGADADDIEMEINY